jgi:hypothetical protein
MERHSVIVSSIFQNDNLREVQCAFVDYFSEYKFCMNLLPRLKIQHEQKEKRLNDLLRKK